MSRALAYESVSLRRGSTVVLDALSLELGAGEILAVLGPSGAGKSTLVRLALGFDAPDAGVVRLGEDIASEPGRIVLPPERRGLAVVFQDLALWPHMTVAENLRFVLPRNTDPGRITAMLARVGLADKRQRRPGELSGGEQQRVAIARALVADPPAVLLDEPLANLDIVLAAELLDLFAELLRERTKAALYVTHDPREAILLADRIAVIEAGRIVQTGTAAELRATPATPFIERAFADF